MFGAQLCNAELQGGFIGGLQIALGDAFTDRGQCLVILAKAQAGNAHLHIEGRLRKRAKIYGWPACFKLDLHGFDESQQSIRPFCGTARADLGHHGYPNALVLVSNTVSSTAFGPRLRARRMDRRIHALYFRTLWVE